MQSKFKSDYGKFEWTAGKFYGDAEKDKGMDFVSEMWFVTLSHNLLIFD